MSNPVRSDIDVPAVSALPVGHGVSSSSIDTAHAWADAAVVLAFWANPAAWMRRRVEHLELVDSDWVRRSVTLEVDISWGFVNGIAGHGLDSVLVPITVSTRAARLTSIEATDDGGRVLAPASRWQTATVIGSVIGRALQHTGPGPGPDWYARFSRIAQFIGHGLAGGAGPQDHEEIFEGLPAPVSSLAAELMAQRLVLLRVPHDETPHLIRLDWEEEIVRAPGVFSRLRGALGGVTILMGASGVGSYHLEVGVPEGLAIEDVTFISSSGMTSPRLERARDHIEVPVAGVGEVLLRLRPATGTLSVLLTLALSALGLSLALIAVTPNSASQNAVAALLLVLPGVLSLYWAGVSDWFSFVEFGVARQLLFAATFLAAGTLSIGGHGEAVRGLLTASAGGMAIAVMALVALGLSGRRRVNPAKVSRSPMFVSYRAEPPATATDPDDQAIEEAVEELIRWLPTAETSPSGLTAGDDDLQERAAVLAERSSWVASTRPQAPFLSGRIVEDVVTLTGISRGDLAVALGVSPTDLAPQRDESELPHQLHRQLAALRAAGLALYGGLGAAGVGQWLTAGAAAPIAAIAAGRVDEVRAKLDRYMTSPAE